MILPVEPIDTVALFPRLSGELLSLLKNLAPAEWQRPTACAGWTVKDVTAHLLGGNLGRLRDDTGVEPMIERPSLDYAELLDAIDRGNAEWVQAARRINSNLLVQFLEITDGFLYQQFKAADLSRPARIGVSWAGEVRSLAWFDIAREYTEKWLHQQHIREAVGSPLLETRDYLFPVLDTFMRGLPYAYRHVTAGDGVSVVVHIEGLAGGLWSLRRVNQTWQLFSGRAGQEAHAAVRLPQQVAWRLFTKGLPVEEGRKHTVVEGDESLAEQVMHMVSIMA